MRTAHRLLVLALVIGLTPAVALARGQQPGSRLFYPVHDSSSAFTVISVTNSSLMATTGSTSVKFDYYSTFPDPGDPLVPSGCVILDRHELLTAADTFSVLTTCHIGAGNQGYLLVTAQDPAQFDVDWAFDHLQGSEIVITAAGGVYSLNAVAFEADDAGQLIPGDQIPYESLPDKISIDAFVAPLRNQLSLTAFMADPDDIAQVAISAWNDNEQPLSSTFEMGCWFDVPLTTVSSLFSQAVLSGTAHDPNELDVTCNTLGSLETGWCLIDCLKVEGPGGNTVDPDGVPLMGALTSGAGSIFSLGRNLWEQGEEDVIDP